jgi:hypothetical protein
VVPQYTVDGRVRWTKVAEYLPGRRDNQCRARWCYRVNPKLKSTSSWTKEELKILLLLKHRMDGSENHWTEMTSQFTDRSSKCLATKWRVIRRRVESLILLKQGTTRTQLLQDNKEYQFGKKQFIHY